MPSFTAPWRRSATFLIAAASWLVAGCQNKADDTPVPTTATDPSAVQEQAILAFDTVGQLTDGVDELARGDFSQLVGDLGLPGGVTLREGEEVTWDPAQGAWVLDAEATETDETGTVAYDVFVWIQFRDAQGNSQQNPDESTADMAVNLDLAVSLESQDGPDYFAFAFDYSMNMAIAGLPDGPFPVTGSGDITTTLVWNSPDIENVNETLTMGWGMDLTVPSNGGCPTGTMSVSVESYQVDATYDGSNVYSWQLRENGVVIDAGVEGASCAAPAS